MFRLYEIEYEDISEPRRADYNIEEKYKENVRRLSHVKANDLKHAVLISYSQKLKFCQVRNLKIICFEFKVK